MTKEERQATKLHMDLTVSEKVFLWRYLAASHSYYEFGSGRGTVLACKRKNIQKLEVIDSSSRKFQNLLNVSTCINQSHQNKRLVFRVISIGPVNELGSPIGVKDRKLWRNYPESILNHTAPSPDLVYIDGRFRVFSALMTLYSLPKKPPLIMVHDFFSRPLYHEVLRHLEIIDCVGNIALLTAKDSIDRNLLVNDIKKFFYRFE